MQIKWNDPLYNGVVTSVRDYLLLFQIFLLRNIYLVKYSEFHS